MAEPRKLTMGVDCEEVSMLEEESRVAELQATVEYYLPEFVKAVLKMKGDANGEESILLLHQDAFASGYDDDEYTLLGMAIKYAGLHGVAIQVIGKNHATF